MPKRPAALLALNLSVSLFLGGVPLMRTSAYTNLPAPNKGKKSCASCPFGSRGAQAGGNAADLSTLGRRTQPQHLLPIQVSAFEGARLNFVGTSDGNLAFAVNDLELSGPMPLFFQRVYASDRREDTGLGAGWSFVFDDRITLDGDSATLMTGTGAVITFRRAVGGHFVPQTDAPGLHQSFDLTDGETISEQAAGLTRTYRKLGGAYRLARIADPNDNSINIYFNDRSNVSRIASGSASLSLEWSGGKRPLLLSVADSAGRRVSFRQDGQRLRAVTDAAGAEWSYDYAGGRLTRASDPVGRVLLRVRYDNAGRAVEAGDAAGAYLFEYDAAPDAVSRRTTVTDPVGAKTIFTHSGRGALAAIADEEGQLASIEYNAANRLVLISDSLGNEVTFAYDSQNRLLRQSSSDGVEKSYTYDERGRISSITDGGVRTEYTLDARGNVLAARGGDPSDGYDATRNARGQLTSLASKGGRKVSFEYDTVGNETAFIFSDAGRFEREYDAAGRTVAERLPSNLAYAYSYDARGQLMKQSDNKGRAVTMERDAGGALIGVASADGRWVRATRDGVGRIVALSNSSGKSRRYEYDARGSLTGYTDARGKHRTFTYDRRGRLRGFFDSDGTGLRYDYDRAGHLLAARRVSGTQTRGAARLMPASYHPPGLNAPGQDEFGCPFSNDGWFDGDTFYQDFGVGCIDPFGGFGDLGDSDGNIFYGTSDGCNFCKARRKAICEAQWWSTYKKSVGADVLATAACALISAGSLALVCAAAAGIVAMLQVSAANDDYTACVLSIPDQCTSYCQNG
jgi:YD repeat-containing protein